MGAVAGGGNNEESELSEQAQAACDGSAIDVTSKLPPASRRSRRTSSPTRRVGPTQVVEGYFDGDGEEAHEEFQKELKGAGYDILFDEVEAPNGLRDFLEGRSPDGSGCAAQDPLP